MSDHHDTPRPPSLHREPIEADREAGELVAIQADYVAASELMGGLEDAGMAFSMGQKEWRTMVNTFRNHRLAFSTPAASDAEAMREACAKVAGTVPTDWRDGSQPGPLSAYRHAAREIAAAIRALPLPKAGEGEA